MRPGDPHSTHEGLLEHQAFLRRLARSLVTDLHGAEDLAQDAAVIALERPPPDEGSFRGWLARVVRNRAIDARRKERRRQDRERNAASTELPRTPEETEEHLQVQRRVFDAVAALEEPYRTVIVLRYYHELGPAAIAVQLGVPVATVKSRLTRALARLREQLDDTQPRNSRAWIAVLAGGIGELPRPTAATALAAGGVAMGVKLAAGTAAIGALGLGWWLSRPEPARVKPPIALSSPTSELESAIEAPSSELRTPERAAERTELESDQQARTAESPAPPPDWCLALELRGWSESDEGTVAVSLFPDTSEVAAALLAIELAPEHELDLAELFADAGNRPHRLTVKLDHPAFLPAVLEVLVPQALFDAGATQGRMEAAVELVRASAIVTGIVSVHESHSVAQARAAIFAFEKDRPAREPIDVSSLDASGRFRLRADRSAEHVIVAFIQREPGRRDKTLRPETRRVTLEPDSAHELEPIALGEGECIEGRVTFARGKTPPPGRVVAELAEERGWPWLEWGMVWSEDRVEVGAADQAWNDNGTFRLTGLAPHAYRVSPGTGGSCGVSARIEVGETKTAGVEVQAPASGVELELGGVEVVLAVVGAGRPVEGARVKATWEEKSGSSSRWATTDATGRVAIVLDPLDDLDLEIADPRWPWKELTLTPAKLISSFGEIEIQLEGEPQEPATLAIHYRGDESALAGTIVDLTLFDLDKLSDEELQRHKTGFTMSGGSSKQAVLGSIFCQPDGVSLKWKEVDGTWVVADLRPARYLARFAPRPAEAGTPCFLLGKELEIEARPGDRVELDWRAEIGGALRLDLSALEELASARLVDVEGVKLPIYYLQHGPRGSSGSDAAWEPGIYELDTCLAAGTYDLKVKLNGGESRLIPVRIEPGRVVDVRVSPEDF